MPSHKLLIHIIQNPWHWIFPENMKFTDVTKIFPALIEYESSFLCS